MESVDYTKLIPAAPVDLVEWIRKNKLIKEPHYIMFKADYLFNGLTDKRERMARCKCSACGDEFWAEWVNVEPECSHGQTAYGINDGREEIISGSHWLCPQCGEGVTLLHVTGRGGSINEQSWSIVLSKLGRSLLPPHTTL